MRDGPERCATDVSETSKSTEETTDLFSFEFVWLSVVVNEQTAGRLIEAPSAFALLFTLFAIRCAREGAEA